MAKLLQLRGGTTSQHSSFTGAVREVTVDTDKDTLVVHDGSTAGGFALPRTSAEILALVTNDSITGAKIQDNVALAGSPTTTTQSASDNSTKIATTAYTDAAIAALSDSAPSTLNTLNELAAALGDDANYATTTTNAIAAKLPLAGGTMTGDLILGDNVKVEVGSLSGGDLEIYHDGSHTRMQNNTGNLNIRTGVLSVTNVADNETILSGTANGSVDLYHNNAKKFETYASGVSATGNVLSTTGIFGLDANDNVEVGTGDINFNINGNQEMRLEADGDLHVDGDVIAYSTTISDERLKDNIEVVDGALDKVKQLKGVTFNRKQDGQESAGVIAQDVEKVLPQAIKHKALPLQTGDDGLFMTVQYDALHALLIESIKELSARVEELEKK